VQSSYIIIKIKTLQGKNNPQIHNSEWGKKEQTLSMQKGPIQTSTTTAKNPRHKNNTTNFNQYHTVALIVFTEGSTAAPSGEPSSGQGLNFT